MQRIIITITLCCTSFLVRAQNKMSLEEVLQNIQANHPAVKMYDADIRSSDEAAKGAKSWMPPELGSGLWMVPYNPSYWKKTADGMNGMGQYMVSAQQMFPNKKEQQANAAYMQAMSSATTETKQATLNELYAAAKGSYYNWMMLEKKLKVLEDNQHILEFMIQSAELRYKNNLGKLTAYYKAKAAIGIIENQRIEMQGQIRQQQVILNTLMNRDKLTPFEIDTVYVVKEYGAFDSSYFLQSRSDIKAIDRTIDITNLQQNLERTKLKPQFGVRYEHMFGFGGLPMQYTLMGMVRLPMVGWSSKSTKANIESLKWKAESLQQQKQMITNEATGEAEELMTSINTKKKQVQLYEENIIPALKKNFNILQLGYEQNTEELFELFDAWETLSKAQMEYVNQVQELLMMQVTMDKILEQK